MSDYTIGEIAAWLLLAGAVGFVLGWLVRELQVRAARRRAPRPAMKAAPAPAPAPEDVPPPQVPDVVDPPTPAATTVRAGVDPPSADHLIKGNTSSKIYHLPDSPSYARTKAGVWFRTEAEAEEAGFRKAGTGRSGTKKKAPTSKAATKKKPPAASKGS